MEIFHFLQKCLIFQGITYPMPTVLKGKHFRILHIFDKSGVKMTNWFLTPSFKIYKGTVVAINVFQCLKEHYMPYPLLVAFRLNMSINADMIIKRQALRQKKDTNRLAEGVTLWEQWSTALNAQLYLNLIDLQNLLLKKKRYQWSS